MAIPFILCTSHKEWEQEFQAFEDFDAALVHSAGEEMWGPPSPSTVNPPSSPVPTPPWDPLGEVEGVLEEWREAPRMSDD